MKLALILPAVIGMLDSGMSASGQIPGFPDGRPLQMSPTSPTPSRPTPSLSHTSAAHKANQSDKPNFSGTWTLDLKASTSFEPLMKRIGASFLERKYADSARLKATLHQTEHVLTIAARGPAFTFDDTLYLGGRTHPGNLKLLGATSLKTRTAWSKDHKRLFETHHIKTKQGKEGELIIERHLINEGKTLVVTYTLKLHAEPDTTSGRQTWHKQA